MKMVSQTHPPSLAVVIDPILVDKVTLYLGPSDISLPKIVTVYAKKSFIGAIHGIPANNPIPPALMPGCRAIANVWIEPESGVILDENILEY